MAEDPYSFDEEVDERKVQEELEAIHDFHQQEDLSWVLSDVRGRRFLWRLLDEAGVYTQPFVGQRETTDFNCGRKDFALSLLALLVSQAPGMYAKMLREAKDYDRYITELQRKRDGGDTATA